MSAVGRVADVGLPAGHGGVTPRGRFAAAIFDMDGVLTDTASLHARAWKQLFDDYLARHAAGAPPFDAVADYLRYVDGRLREDGVRGFLDSRGLTVPTGTPADDEEAQTVYGLAKRKNRLFRAALARDGATVFTASVDFIVGLRRRGVRIGVVSASRNCADILRRAGLDPLVDARVDGLEHARLGLAGKPAPDGFLACAARLGVRPAQALVVEDAESGVAAARAGGFGWVIGVARHGNAGALRKAGAQRVVASLAELDLEGIDAGCATP